MGWKVLRSLGEKRYVEEGLDKDGLEATDDEEKEEGDTSDFLEDVSDEASRHSFGTVTDAAIVLPGLRNKSSPRESRAGR